MSDEKHPGGHPLKFQSVKELERAIGALFTECEREEDTRVYKHGESFEWPDKDAKTEVRCKECRGLVMDEYGLPTRGCIRVSGELKLKVKPTITGLAIWLDCDKETIRDYRGREEFSAPIKKAYLWVERGYEEELHSDKVQPAKTIFALSNFGWKNPQHIEQKLDVNRDGASALADALLNAHTAPAGNDSRPLNGTTPRGA